MSKSDNSQSMVGYYTVAVSFFIKDLLLVTQNGSITVVLLPLQTKEIVILKYTNSKNVVINVPTTTHHDKCCCYTSLPVFKPVHWG
jgi:hypothetical protein